MRRCLFVCLSLLLSGCTGIPDGVVPVEEQAHAVQREPARVARFSRRRAFAVVPVVTRLRVRADVEAILPVRGLNEEPPVIAGCRQPCDAVGPIGRVENPEPLATYDETHPYIVAAYDTPDTEVMAG